MELAAINYFLIDKSKINLYILLTIKVTFKNITKMVKVKENLHNLLVFLKYSE